MGIIDSGDSFGGLSEDNFEILKRQLDLGVEAITELEKLKTLCSQKDQMSEEVAQIETIKNATAGKIKNENALNQRVSKINSVNERCLEQAKKVRAVLGNKQEDIIFFIAENHYIDSKARTFIRRKGKYPNETPEDFVHLASQAYIDGSDYQNFRSNRIKGSQNKIVTRQYFDRWAIFFQKRMLQRINAAMIDEHLGDKNKSQLEELKEKAVSYKRQLESY